MTHVILIYSPKWTPTLPILVLFVPRSRILIGILVPERMELSLVIYSSTLRNKLREKFSKNESLGNYSSQMYRKRTRILVLS